MLLIRIARAGAFLSAGLTVLIGVFGRQSVTTIMARTCLVILGVGYAVLGVGWVWQRFWPFLGNQPLPAGPEKKPAAAGGPTEIRVKGGGRP